MAIADTTISISVDAATAQAYNQAPTEDQKKIQILLRLRMRELLNTSTSSLSQLMDEIGARAEARGLTPEVLETLLRDE
ncbi:MAG: hypothetical protein HC769_01335 [Cyanobacteria bacterium CRU_2_1]|nr:hypothetical protein [Cyanobacteria bacterium RU_5_0]NJR57608.1 hypothetical protein [Cyanobacteria bacterium CRU_2_1]